MENKDFRSVDSNTRKEIRKFVIKVQSGVQKKVIAKMYGVNPNTITNWVKKYTLKGSKGLVHNKKAAKSENKKLLSIEQEREMREMIVDVVSDQLRLNYTLWTRRAVKELIEREFGVVLVINTIGDYLRSWGLILKNQKVGF